jgi:xanthine/CO dehydrogenase XdhC/CoxF family maturation factor
VSHLQAVVEAYARLRARGVGLALATVFSAVGPVCRRPGARLLVSASGETAGCIGAGCMERDVTERAARVIASGRLVIVQYDANPETDIVWGLGLGCGGVTEVLIEPLGGDGPDALAFIADRLARRRAGAMATVVRPHGPASISTCSRLFVSQDVPATGSAGDPELDAMLVRDASDALTRDAPAAAREYRMADRTVKALVEVIRPAVSLVVFGADQDAVPLVRFASQLGWQVTVVDSRVGLATAARFPGAASVVVCPPERAVQAVPLDARTAVVIMMHQYVWDMEVLRMVLTSPVRYVGVLGPRQRTDDLLRQLGTGAAAQAAGRLHAPVGLDIGAETSEEIGFAIVAEIQAVVAGRTGGFLRDRSGPAHLPGEPGR